VTVTLFIVFSVCRVVCFYRCLAVWCAAKAFEQSVWDKLDGRVDAEGYNTVLRIRTGTTESALLEHIILKGWHDFEWFVLM